MPAWQAGLNKQKPEHPHTHLSTCMEQLPASLRAAWPCLPCSLASGAPLIRGCRGYRMNCSTFLSLPRGSESPCSVPNSQSQRPRVPSLHGDTVHPMSWIHSRVHPEPQHQEPFASCPSLCHWVSDDLTLGGLWERRWILMITYELVLLPRCPLDGHPTPAPITNHLMSYHGLFLIWDLKISHQT